jgi:hypothetical protein
MTASILITLNSLHCIYKVVILLVTTKCSYFANLNKFQQDLIGIGIGIGILAMSFLNNTTNNTTASIVKIT